MLQYVLQSEGGTGASGPEIPASPSGSHGKLQHTTTEKLPLFSCATLIGCASSAV